MLKKNKTPYIVFGIPFNTYGKENLILIEDVAKHFGITAQNFHNYSPESTAIGGSFLSPKGHTRKGVFATAQRLKEFLLNDENPKYAEILNKLNMSKDESFQVKTEKLNETLFDTATKCDLNPNVVTTYCQPSEKQVFLSIKKNVEQNSDDLENRMQDIHDYIISKIGNKPIAINIIF